MDSNIGEWTAALTAPIVAMAANVIRIYPITGSQVTSTIDVCCECGCDGGDDCPNAQQGIASHD